MQTKAKWKLRVEHASGETKTHRIPENGLVLSDIVREQVSAPIDLIPYQGTFWLKSLGAPNAVRISGNDFIEGQVPVETTIQIGSTKLMIISAVELPKLPEFPVGRTPWLTTHPEGVNVIWKTKKVAATNLAVYIEGETGTGKEILAHLIHSWSDRASGPFVPLNCAALTPSLTESELFGHVKGAFTGAHRDRPGALLQAHGGTLFLDEIGDLNFEAQAKLLRFLENGELRPVGSDRIAHSQVRVVCATHKPLLELVNEGKFRRDLYYRLAMATILIPPLRQRLSDIDYLATEFARNHDRLLSESAIFKLRSYSWPGNVRELKHSIERAAGMASPFDRRLTSENFDIAVNETVELAPEMSAPGIMTLSEMERAMIIKALRLAHGHRGNSAKMLGISRSALFDMMKRYQIRGPRMAHVQALLLTENELSEKNSLYSAFR